VGVVGGEDGGAGLEGGGADLFFALGDVRDWVGRWSGGRGVPSLPKVMAPKTMSRFVLGDMLGDGCVWSDLILKNGAEMVA
jgi:hypothetical protein